MSLLSKLFGGGGGSSPKEAEPELYNEFRIFPEPAKEGGGHRIAARIEKTIDGEVKIHNLIRADTCNSLDEAREVSVRKAKQVIDEQGEAIFR